MERRSDAGDGEGRKLFSLIEKATNSTAQEVDPRLLKAIKYIVRSSDDEVRFAIEALMEKMKKKHSQVRYLALLIVDELFMRSKLFRSLLVVNFDQFLSLSVGFRSSHPLPPPDQIASRLRSKSIELLEKWNDSFGIHYRQLRLGVDYLKNTLKFQFPNRLGTAQRLREERREREMRSKEILLNKFGALKDNFPSIKGEIQSTLHEIGECMEIIHNEDKMEAAGTEDDSVEEFRSSSLLQIRLAALREGEKVQENSENEAVFDTIRELYKLLVSKHLSTVQEWTSVLVRVEPTDTKYRDSLLKELIDIRNNLLSVKKKCEQLGIPLKTTAAQEEEEDIWEDGKIEAYINEASGLPDNHGEYFPSMPEDKAQQKGEKDLKDEELDDEAESSDSEAVKKRLLAEAPVKKWGTYLDNWGAKRDVPANQRGLELEGHWGRVDYDAVIPAEKIAELNVQASVYKEELEEIQPCLAPLAKGGLCQRRDLRVCPFHGPIIPRDQEGNPINEVSSTKEKAQEEAPSNDVDFVIDEDLDVTKAADELAKQAVKNVRAREHEEKKKHYSGKPLKRAKLEKVRQHNEAVLREAAVASTSGSEIIGEVTSMNKGKKQSLASMLQKKVTTKDRISQKLLNKRVTDAAIRQLRKADEAGYRENYPNQW